MIHDDSSQVLEIYLVVLRHSISDVVVKDAYSADDASSFVNDRDTSIEAHAA
jgi:hypothetical protein